MADFDINKELEVIIISDNLNEINLSSGDSIINIEYFYHGHRLGTRVPLFVIISSEDWNEDAICYFCKIGNSLSIKISPLMSQFNLISHSLSKLLRRYGSNYGISCLFKRGGTPTPTPTTPTPTTPTRPRPRPSL